MKILRNFLILALMLLQGFAFASDIIVGTWNVKRLGHGQKQNYEALAEIAQRMDIIALQEVMTESGLERLEKTLERRTGESWSTMASHAIGSSSYKEFYAFLWRDKAVEYDEGAVVFLDSGDRFIREPFSAQFKSRRDNSKIAIATVHILYGKGISDREPEIRELSEYWTWFTGLYPEAEHILVGDFNLDPKHGAWQSLKAYARPLVTSGASTLSSTNGHFANLYDNVWVANNSQLKISGAGIINFPKILGFSHEVSRASVSDHAPLYLTLGNVNLNISKGHIAESESVEPNNKKTMSLPVSPQSAPSTMINFESGVRGNKNTKIYHRADCPSYNKIAEKNRVEFVNAQQAIASGYRLAGNCR